jgi:hypothetical protein
MWELQIEYEETPGWLHSPYGSLQMKFVKKQSFTLLIDVIFSPRNFLGISGFCILNEIIQDYSPLSQLSIEPLFV